MSWNLHWLNFWIQLHNILWIVAGQCRKFKEYVKTTEQNSKGETVGLRMDTTGSLYHEPFAPEQIMYRPMVINIWLSSVSCSDNVIYCSCKLNCSLCHQCVMGIGWVSLLAIPINTLQGEYLILTCPWIVLLWLSREFFLSVKFWLNF